MSTNVICTWAQLSPLGYPYVEYHDLGSGMTLPEKVCWCVHVWSCMHLYICIYIYTYNYYYHYYYIYILYIIIYIYIYIIYIIIYIYIYVLDMHRLHHIKCIHVLGVLHDFTTAGCSTRWNGKVQAANLLSQPVGTSSVDHHPIKKKEWTSRNHPKSDFFLEGKSM